VGIPGYLAKMERNLIRSIKLTQSYPGLDLAGPRWP